MNFLFQIVFFKGLLFALVFTVKAEDLKSVETSYIYKGNRVKSLGFLKKDTEYYQHHAINNLDIIYSEDFKSFSDVLSNYVEKIDLKLSKIFQFSPYYRRNFVFFPSSRRQISNAFAVVYPVPFVKMYSFGSADFIDQWSIFYWTQDVLIHEMTHNYQLSQNSKWDRKLWRILGPVSHRNSLIGSFALEGNAVFNESIYGFGGRLFSGWVRAFVFSQIKQGFPLKRVLKSYDDPFSILEKYLHGGYFFAYLHSQYNTKKIHQVFSESGQWLSIGFYSLNRSFRTVFGKDIEALFESYKEYYTPLAEKQQSSPEKAILKSKVQLPMNSNKDKIYFLVSDSKSPPQLVLFDKKTKKIQKKTKNLPLGKVFYKEGNYYSSANARTSSTSVEFSLFGENFKPVQKYNSQYIMDFYQDRSIALDARQNHIQNTLLVEEDFYDSIHSSAIMDHRGRIYYFKQNREVRTLYRDKEPLFSFPSYYAYPVEADEEGLYFISSTKYGSSLFVYKESDRIFRLSESDTISYARKIEGNEFLVSEITPTHYEYKVISTQETSGKPFLYTYSFKKENIFESSNETLSFDSLSREENIQIMNGGESNREAVLNVENRTDPVPALSLLNQNESELDHNYPASFSKEETAMGTGDYSDETESSKANEKLSKAEKFIKSNRLVQKTDHKPYNFLSNLALQQFFLFAYNNTYFSSFLFMDPLKFNELSLYNSVGSKYKHFNLSYVYKKYRPSLSFSLDYEESFLSERKDKHRIQTLKEIGFLNTEDIFYSDSNRLKKKQSIFQRDRSFGLSMTYPLLIKPQWRLLWINNLQLGQKQFNNEDAYVGDYPIFLFHKPKPWKSYIQHAGILRYSFERKYKYAYSSHKRRILQLSYNILSLGKKLQLENTYWNGQTQIYLTEEFGKEWFVTLDGTAAINLWDREPQRFLSQKRGGINYGSFRRAFRDLYQLDFQVLKVLNHSYYPLTVPFSMRRWAPLAGLSLLSFKPFHKKYKVLLVPFVGAEWELNFFEVIIFQAGVSGEYIMNFSTSSSPSTVHLSAWLKGTF